MSDEEGLRKCATEGKGKGVELKVGSPLLCSQHGDNR